MFIISREGNFYAQVPALFLICISSTSIRKQIKNVRKAACGSKKWNGTETPKLKFKIVLSLSDKMNIKDFSGVEYCEHRTSSLIYIHMYIN